MKRFCQGPRCHTYDTQSRIRGTKDNKVLRTRRAAWDIDPVDQWQWRQGESVWKYFCDDRCLHAWLKDNLSRCMQFVGERTEPLETPINVTKTKYQRELYGGGTYIEVDTKITKLTDTDTSTNVSS